MKQLLKFIVSHIVADKAKIVIEEQSDDNQVLLTLEVAADDMGKIIGKGGKTIRAIRILLATLAVKEGKHVYLEVVEKTKPTVSQ